jgi:hypothetical protein
MFDIHIQSNWLDEYLFGAYLVWIWCIFGIYSNIRHRISIIRIWIYYFIGTNIFGIHIRSKPKLWIYSYSVQNLIFVLHWNTSGPSEVSTFYEIHSNLSSFVLYPKNTLLSSFLKHMYCKGEIKILKKVQKICVITHFI